MHSLCTSETIALPTYICLYIQTFRSYMWRVCACKYIPDISTVVRPIVNDGFGKQGTLVRLHLYCVQGGSRHDVCIFLSLSLSLVQLTSIEDHTINRPGKSLNCFYDLCVPKCCYLWFNSIQLQVYIYIYRIRKGSCCERFIPNPCHVVSTTARRPFRTKSVERYTLSQLVL